MVSDAPVPGVVGSAVVATRFDDFFRGEYGAVVRLAWSLTGRRVVAEELAQDAFLEAHRHWPQISRYDDPSAWVRRVVINRSLSTLRRAATETRLLLRLQGLRRRDDTSMPEASDGLWQAVRRLPRRQAEVIALVVVEDMSVDHVAGVLGCGAETVRTHLRRARAALAEMLAEDDHDAAPVGEGEGRDESR